MPPKRVEQQVRETVFGAFPAASFDRKAGIIRHAKLLGAQSANKRRYTDAALESAAKAYEGVPVNVDHPRADESLGAPRSFWDRLGYARRCVAVPGDGTYGDVECNPAHPALERLEWFATNPGARVGFSPNHAIAGHYEGEEFVVEAVPVAVSVDLVGDPATVRGVFEQAAPAAEDVMEIKTVAEMKQAYPALVAEAEQAARDAVQKGEREQTMAAENKRLSERLAVLEQERAKVARVQELAQVVEELKAAPVMTDAFRAVCLEAKDQAAMRALVLDRLSVLPTVTESAGKTMPKATGTTEARKLVPPAVVGGESLGAWLNEAL
jgi:hypothetical protein